MVLRPRDMAVERPVLRETDFGTDFFSWEREEKEEGGNLNISVLLTGVSMSTTEYPSVQL